MNALATIDTKPLMARSLDEARNPLLILFAAYPEPWTDKNAKKVEDLMQARVSAYLLGLEGLPAWAIEQAVKDFIQGRIDRPARRRGALPTVEEISAEARTHVDIEASRQRREKLQQEQIAERNSEMPLEHRQRMLFKMSLLSAAWSAPLQRIDALAEANKRGMDELMALAQSWGVPIPECVWGMKRA